MSHPLFQLLEENKVISIEKINKILINSRRNKYNINEINENHENLLMLFIEKYPMSDYIYQVIELFLKYNFNFYHNKNKSGRTLLFNLILKKDFGAYFNPNITLKLMNSCDFNKIIINKKNTESIQFTNYEIINLLVKK